MEEVSIGASGHKPHSFFSFSACRHEIGLAPSHKGARGSRDYLDTTHGDGFGFGAKAAYSGPSFTIAARN
jgi:hypothetical protein